MKLLQTVLIVFALLGLGLLVDRAVIRRNAQMTQGGSVQTAPASVS